VSTERFTNELETYCRISSVVMMMPREQVEGAVTLQLDGDLPHRGQGGPHQGEAQAGAGDPCPLPVPEAWRGTSERGR